MTVSQSPPAPTRSRVNSVSRRKVSPSKDDRRSTTISTQSESVIRFSRMNYKGLNSLMGRTSRCFVTGQVRLRHPQDFPDFSLVDLWTRKRLSGHVQQFEKDLYLFHPVPLAYRTWIYHNFYTQKKVYPSADECGMIREVLSEWCIDAPVRAGRWSPLMAWVPLVFATCLTGEILSVVVPALCILCWVFFVSWYTNTAAMHRFSRLITLPVRLGFMGFVAWKWNSGDSLALAGFLIAIACWCLDLWQGDMSQVFCYKLQCSYEVLRVLPNRVIICRRKGAAHLEELFKDRGKVDERVSGMGTWEKDFTIFADIQGVIMELRPVTPEEWQKLHEDSMRDVRENVFVGLDVYGSVRPSVDALGLSDEELHALRHKLKREREEQERNWVNWLPATLHRQG